MENTFIHTENTSLREILNNLNSGLYKVVNYNNIRIYSNKKPNFIILNVESNVSENLVNYFGENKNIKFESTYNDYIVISKENNESLTISLFELILSSEILNIEDSQKWSLDIEEFICEEINYIFEKEINFKETDMKILG